MCRYICTFSTQYKQYKTVTISTFIIRHLISLTHVFSVQKRTEKEKSLDHPIYNQESNV